MEDYKEKYENALERARKINNGDGVPAPPDYTICETIFPELKESEDERIRKGLINFLKSPFVNENITDEKVTPWLAWIEKQDPKKHEEELENAYKCADEVQYRKGYEDARCEFKKQSEQKSTDKIEPKFKNGQWIVWQDKYYKVYDNGCGYELVDQNGLSKSLEYENINKNTHLWNIAKDAKDGDVLTVDTWTFIFKKYQYKSVYYHCAFSTFNIFSISTTGELDSDYVHPANKEQRDLLFSKMKEAGYKWDSEKKELKKIEQKHTCKIDNSYTCVKFPFKVKVKSSGKIVTIHDGQLSFDGKEWIKYQSDKEDGYKIYEPNDLELVCETEQKSLWSEEDEDYYDAIIAKLEVTQGDALLTDNQMEFLKSLKERYTWKPSDEQMKQLSWVAEQNKDNTLGKELMTLYQDLKKLRDK